MVVAGSSDFMGHRTRVSKCMLNFKLLDTLYFIPQKDIVSIGHSSSDVVLPPLPSAPNNGVPVQTVC